MNSHLLTSISSFFGFGRSVRRCFTFLLFCFLLIGSHANHSALGQQLDVEDLKSLSIEELMNIQVTSVSRRPERLTQTASAIQVIPGETITKYGATNIPEALYLAGNLQVAQRGAAGYSISARGFNTELSNKLLVLIDGRTVYTPLFSGVFWDRQDYLLEDLNRIEVISGPGGTLWGANAVNGVINIRSKSSEETQGWYLAGVAGNELHGQGALRYGGQIGENTHFRIYGKYTSRDATTYPDSTEVHDDWKMGQGGFRMDSRPNSQTKVTLQGDLYKNRGELNEGGIAETTGGNVLGRISYMFDDSSTIRLQTYYDRTMLTQGTPARNFAGNEVPAGTLKDDLTTFDLELQHRFSLGSWNRFVWGLGYRYTYDQVTNAPALGFLPENLQQDLYTIFVQDEISMMDNLAFILGTKLEHNDYTGFVLEPNARLRWNVTDNQLLWAAVSRAVRIPSRVDRDLRQATPPYFQLLVGNPDFRSETVIAWESGFRSTFGTKATGSISFFYNQYDDIRSAVLDPVNVFPVTFENGIEGETYGWELSMTWQVTDWWRLTTNYNRLWEDLRIAEGETDINSAYNEVADPAWQIQARSAFTLPYRISINPAFRVVDRLLINNGGTQAVVPRYAELDGRIIWSATDNMEISVAGRNLLHKQHVEYGPPGPERLAIQRSVYGKLVFRF